MRELCVREMMIKKDRMREIERVRERGNKDILEKSGLSHILREKE
jgi:hypothetical protein